MLKPAAIFIIDSLSYHAPSLYPSPQGNVFKCLVPTKEIICHPTYVHVVHLMGNFNSLSMCNLFVYEGMPVQGQLRKGATVKTLLYTTVSSDQAF